MRECLCGHRTGLSGRCTAGLSAFKNQDNTHCQQDCKNSQRPFDSYECCVAQPVCPVEVHDSLSSRILGMNIIIIGTIDFLATAAAGTQIHGRVSKKF